MTKVSQNGWSVSPPNMDDLIVAGIDCGPVRAGDVFTVMQYVATRYNREVQPLKAGQCGGYNPRSIAGSKTPSNHASATANDFNWNENPEHKRTMSVGERNACHRIIDDCDGVVRWGGDYHGDDVDEMHWEINAGPAAVAALAKQIKEELPVDSATFNKLMDDWAATANGKAALVAGARQALNENAYGPVAARESVALRIGHVDQAVDEINAKLDALAVPTPEKPL